MAFTKEEKKEKDDFMLTCNKYYTGGNKLTYRDISHSTQYGSDDDMVALTLVDRRGNTLFKFYPKTEMEMNDMLNIHKFTTGSLWKYISSLLSTLRSINEQILDEEEWLEGPTGSLDRYNEKRCGYRKLRSELK